jgi:dihydropteroate synthase
VPVIEAIRRSIDTHISVDTRKAEVAEAGLDAGATMVNDVSGLRDDPALLRLVANRKVPVCIMHMQGSPQTMQRNPEYADPVLDIREELRRRVEAALEGGVAPEQIIVDPGIGFGKTVRDNIALIARLSELRELGYPILVGLSRKSFIGRVLAYGGGPDGAPTTEQAPQKPEPQREPERTGASRFEAIDRVDPRPVEERLAGTLGATALAIHGGADILRVHDVAETADLVTVMGAISHLSTEAGSSR